MQYYTSVVKKNSQTSWVKHVWASVYIIWCVLCLYVDKWIYANKSWTLMNPHYNQQSVDKRFIMQCSFFKQEW